VPTPDGFIIGLYSEYDEDYAAIVKFSLTTGSVQYAFYYNQSSISANQAIVDNNGDIVICGSSGYALERPI
jgi:hypothetical protein